MVIEVFAADGATVIVTGGVPTTTIMAGTWFVAASRLRVASGKMFSITLVRLGGLHR